MANYCSNSRTNYFRVTDEAKYAELFANLVCKEGKIHDFSKIDEDGVHLHGFGSYSSIDYKVPTQDSTVDFDSDFDVFLTELQKILPSDEAFIYREIGHAKLRYVYGYSIVVTNNKIESIDISEGAEDLARKMLGNNHFITQMNY